MIIFTRNVLISLETVKGAVVRVYQQPKNHAKANTGGVCVTRPIDSGSGLVLTSVCEFLHISCTGDSRPIPTSANFAGLVMSDISGA